MTVCGALLQSCPAEVEQTFALLNDSYSSVLFSLSFFSLCIVMSSLPASAASPNRYASVFGSDNQRPAAPLTLLQESRIKLLYFYLCVALRV